MSLLAARVEAGPIDSLHNYETLPLMRDGAFPTGIVVTPNGQVWFCESQRSAIGRYTPGVGFAEFPTPSSLNTQPGFMARGADGNIWFTEYNAHAIGRITPNGTITEFPLPGEFTAPLDITSGPDGNIWFTEAPASRGIDFGMIGRITPSGTISEFVLDRPVLGITRGPDNALWFATRGGRFNGPAGEVLPTIGGIGRMATNGQSTIRDVDGEPLSLTTGADGALWFTNINGQYLIGRYATDGTLTKFDRPIAPTGGGEPIAGTPERIIRGPDDNLWFTNFDGGIWRINQAGTLDEILPLRDEDHAEDITVGTDGKLWFTQPYVDAIGHLDALAFASLNIANGGPLALARGADDSIWFVDAVRSSIGRIGPQGGLLQYELGAGHFPVAVAVGPDGTAWFTDIEQDTIGHITADGEVIYFSIQPKPSNPQDIVLGPDGNFWFTEYDAGSIGRITPMGVIKHFPIAPAAGLGGPRIAVDVSQPQSLAVGPDGNLWFTDPGLNTIGRMTTSGAVVEFSIPSPGADPSGIAAGADGNLYFTEAEPGRIARITTAGVITELGTADPDAFPLYITLGPDGAMWWTESDANRLGRLARDGRITKFDLDPDTYPAGIVGRSDGRLYIAMLNAARIDSTYLAASEPTRTATRTPTPTLTVPPGSTATATRTAGSLGCAGDCDRSGAVSINELIAAVNVALGNAAYDTCVNADADGSGEVQINDLIAAVNAALQGCGA
ncbi:hypothetical protein KF840_13070 [bacterium]|nr:hypothetical protein [bacterium]